MFNAAVLFSLALAAVVVHAEVTPNTPDGSSVYNVGAKCAIAWSGDADSDSKWKGMSIELMTGANLDMVHLTSTFLCLPLPISTFVCSFC